MNVDRPSDYNNGHDPNSGHGHVYKRPDGVKARCGGPPLCSECARDMAALQASYRPQQPVAQVTSNPNCIEQAIKALEPFAAIGQWLFARDLPDDTPMVEVQGINNHRWALTRGEFKAAHAALTALRAALETCDGPTPHHVRWDFLGWLCSVCGGWNDGTSRSCRWPHEHAQKAGEQP